MSEPGRIGRRRLLGLTGAAAAGVATGGWVTWRLTRTPEAAGEATPTTLATTSTTTTTVATTSTTAEPTTTTTPELVTTPYLAVEGEVSVEAKLAGVRVVEALLTYRAADEHREPLERAAELAAVPVDLDSLARAAEPLLVPGVRSTAEVVYPQLGGLDPHADPETASVMVVVVQRLDDGRQVRQVSRCVDVRVRRVDGTWGLESLADAAGAPVDRPTSLPAEAVRVLDHPDIRLPDSARWDIHDGTVHPRLLTAIADLADRTPIAITTCKRGHPPNVFHTGAPSAHSVGRAVDIWEVGGRPVVQQRHDTGSTAHRVAAELFESSQVARLGSPWSFGGGGRSWTDPVHQDHLHLGVNA